MTKERYCLLVEDDEDDQEFFIDALHEASATAGCFVAVNGEEALHALQEPGFSPDYIFTDLNMPRMGGLELLKVIRNTARLKDIPVIVYSADYTKERVAAAIRMGAVAFYRKTTVAILRGILQQYFSEERKAGVHVESSVSY
jgi:CheY-like chemotaxis protein